MKRAAAALLVVGLSATANVRAEEPAKTQHAAAEELFVEGLALLDAGRYAEACEKLERSQAVEGSAGTLLNLADCFEKVGRVASAWSTFRRAAGAASDRRRPDWEKTATRRAAALQPKVSMLTIAISEAAKVEGLVVTCDDAPIEPSIFGVPTPKDPGTHVVIARAPGRKPWSAEARIVRPAERITIEVPLLEVEVDRATRVAAEAPRPPEPRTMGPARTTAVALGISGIVAVGAGTAFGLLARGALDDAKNACPSYPTTGGPSCLASEAHGHNDDAQRDATISTIAFAAGGTLLVGAAVLWFVAPRSSTARVRVGPSLDGRTLGFAFSGAL